MHGSNEHNFNNKYIVRQNIRHFSFTKLISTFTFLEKEKIIEATQTKFLRDTQGNYILEEKKN